MYDVAYDISQVLKYLGDGPQTAGKRTANPKTVFLAATTSDLEPQRDQLRRERNSPVQFGVEGPQDDSRLDDEHEGGFIDHAPGPSELTERQLTQDCILAAWSELSEEHRMVLSLHDVEDYSLPELAQIMEIPIGTLKSRLHRARTRLRDLLLRAERFSLSDRV